MCHAGAWVNYVAYPGSSCENNTIMNFIGFGMSRAQCETVCNDIGLDCLGYMLSDGNGGCFT